MALSISWRDCRTAVLVGPKAEQYYQAELFLLSVRELGTLPMERIIVHCADGVSESFKAWVRASGAAVRDIPSGKDMRYCGALLQLEQMQNELDGCAGALLLDLRTLVLADLELPMIGAVCGKAAEYPDPPLHLLERLFGEAAIPLPGVKVCDRGHGNTLVPLFQSGFVFVPAAMAGPLCTAWRDWLNWLLLRLYIFDSKKQQRLAGQVALAMALVRHAIPYGVLPANIHLSVDDAAPLTSKKSAKSASALTYTSLDAFGVPVSNTADRLSVLDVMRVLTGARNPEYFIAYKENLACKAVLPVQDSFIRLDDLDLWARRPRVILHAGTGSEQSRVLQESLASQRCALLEQGVLYPDNDAQAPFAQWLVPLLLAENEVGWKAALQAVVAQMRSGTHTVLLSAQGLYNHWWDFSPKARDMLLALQDIGEVEMWIWFPEPAAFARELYLQNLANPQFPLAPSYGRDWSFRQTMKNPWFMRHLDYFGFVLEVEALFGPDTVSVMPMHENMQRACMALLSVTGIDDSRTPPVVGWNVAGVDMLRTLNRHPLAGHGKIAVVQQLHALANIPELNGVPFELAQDELVEIKVLTSPGCREMAARFALQWNAI